LDVLGIERVKVIGHDWGGWTAMLLGLLHADRIEQMIVCNAFHPWPPPLTLKLVRGQAWRSWYAYTLATPGLGPWALRRAGIAKEILRRGNVRTPFTEHDIDDYMTRFRDPARAQGVSRLYRYLQRAAREVLMGRWRSHRLTVPTLHLFGERDRYISKHVLPGFERYADDMRLELVHDCGHFIVDERPDLVVARARELFPG
jgi:pimeloyl-ACP methyl ester carboxylesterase